MFGIVEVRHLTDDVEEVMGYNPSPFGVFINVGTDEEELYDTGGKPHCYRVAADLMEETKLHKAGIWTL